jgi:CheY-like chemotaxis protein
MPHIDGFAVMRQLLEDIYDDFVPIFVLTADALASTKHRAFHQHGLGEKKDSAVLENERARRRIVLLRRESAGALFERVRYRVFMKTELSLHRSSPCR